MINDIDISKMSLTEIYDKFKVKETNNSANLRDWQIKLNKFLLLAANILIDLKGSDNESKSIFQIMDINNLPKYLNFDIVSSNTKKEINEYLSSLPGYIASKDEQSFEVVELHGYYLMNLMFMLELNHRYQEFTP